VTALNYIPTTVGNGSFIPASSPAFVVICVIDDSHSDWSEVESQCHFDLHLFTICTLSFENCLLIAHLPIY
jgi:hypothetical protein